MSPATYRLIKRPKQRCLIFSLKIFSRSWEAKMHPGSSTRRKSASSANPLQQCNYQFLNWVEKSNKKYIYADCNAKNILLKKMETFFFWKTLEHLSNWYKKYPEQVVLAVLQCSSIQVCIRKILTLFLIRYVF